MIKPVSAFSALLFTFPVYAHHPLGGMPMETFTHGLLSGFGHPLLGFDHLFFIILVGISSQFTKHPIITPANYIAGMLVGCLMISGGVVLPGVESIVALSLFILGGIMLAGKSLQFTAAASLFALFGLFHGAAFGEAIAAQETAAGLTVLIGYLLGLGCTQYAIALGAGWVNNHIWNAHSPLAIQPRLAGAVVAGAGLFLTLEYLESQVLGVLLG